MHANLAFDLSDMFGYPLKLELTPWQKGVSWLHHVHHKIYTLAYFEDKGLSMDFFTHQPDSQAWQQSFPTNVLAALKDFEQRFEGHTFSALWFVSRSEAACQLLLSAPTLLWMIMDYAKSHQLEPDQVWPWFSAKRKTIVGLYQLPQNNATVHLLSKYHSDHKFSQRDIELIQQLYTRSFYNDKKHGHIPYFDPMRIRLIMQDATILQFKLLQQTGPHITRTQLKHTLDAFYMAQQLNYPQYGQILKTSTHIAQINTIHDQLAEIINQQQANIQRERIYPAPLIPPTDDIEYIQSHYELVIEGKQMHHCIASYDQRIVEGRYLVYRLLQPERATIGIEITHDNRLELDQVRLVCNKQAAPETEHYVRSWINTHTRR